MRLRYFTEREVASIHSFPPSFGFPPHVTRAQGIEVAWCQVMLDRADDDQYRDEDDGGGGFVRAPWGRDPVADGAKSIQESEALLERRGGMSLGGLCDLLEGVLCRRRTELHRREAAVAAAAGAVGAAEAAAVGAGAAEAAARRGERAESARRRRASRSRRGSSTR